MAKYEVQAGDTFAGLVARFGTTRKALARANDIINPASIAQRPGWVIEVPPYGSTSQPVPQTPVPQIPVPQIPVPQIPVPQAPAPTTPQPQAPQPRAPQPQAPRPETPQPHSAHTITVNTAMEIISHEAIVKEAYRDSRGIWTWSVGLTNSSGHHVAPRYIDNPQSVTRCLEVFEWALRTNYGSTVDQVFAGYDLTEAQYAAALSFHYNTGGLRRASWVKRWKAGDIDGAYDSFLNWRKPIEILPRRKKERSLFFDGVWTNNGTTICYPVRKPSYQPDFGNAERIDVRDTLADVLARAGS